jgi:hypothetical protein
MRRLTAVLSLVALVVIAAAAATSSDAQHARSANATKVPPDRLLVREDQSYTVYNDGTATATFALMKGSKTVGTLVSTCTHFVAGAGEVCTDVATFPDGTVVASANKLSTSGTPLNIRGGTDAYVNLSGTITRIDPADPNSPTAPNPSYMFHFASPPGH